MVRRGRRFESVRGLCKGPAKQGFFFRTERRVSGHGRPWKALWKIQSSEPFPTPALGGSVPSRIELWSARFAQVASGRERPGPGTGKELRCKESVCEASRRSRVERLFAPRNAFARRGEGRAGASLLLVFDGRSGLTSHQAKPIVLSGLLDATCALPPRARRSPRRAHRSSRSP
jgi:hypothetical protein